jgi:antitoxin VapB
MGQLNLKDAILVAEAKELAALLGTTATGAVREAVRERLEREKRERDVARKTQEIMEFGRKFAANLTGPPMTKQEMDDFLYDPATGLPW